MSALGKLRRSAAAKVEEIGSSGVGGRGPAVAEMGEVRGGVTRFQGRRSEEIGGGETASDGGDGGGLKKKAAEEKKTGGRERSWWRRRN